MGLLTLLFFLSVEGYLTIRQEQGLAFSPPLTCKSPACDPGVALCGPILEMLSTGKTWRAPRTLQHQIPAGLAILSFS